ncbi:unnamed protein product, partial [Prorocentrum cordatum]
EVHALQQQLRGAAADGVPPAPSEPSASPPRAQPAAGPAVQEPCSSFKAAGSQGSLSSPPASPLGSRGSLPSPFARGRGVIGCGGASLSDRLANVHKGQFHIGMEPPRREVLEKGRLWHLVKSAWFELLSGTAIFLNGVVMAKQAQYTGFDLAEYTGHASKNGPAARIWPHAAQMFDIAYWVFGVFFLFEVVIKIAGLRGEFIRDAWNWVDALIVLFWLLGAIFDSGVNAQFLRLVRLARLVRLIRLLKFMRGHLSDSLFVMLAALQDCFVATLWSIVLFVVVHGMLGICLNEVLVEYYFRDEAFDLAGQQQVYEYFGSFSRSFLTMFEFTFANWITPARVLVENVNEVFIVYAVLHKCMLGVAAVGVIQPIRTFRQPVLYRPCYLLAWALRSCLRVVVFPVCRVKFAWERISRWRIGAVFIQETFQVVQMDDAIMVRQALMREKSHSDKMQALFREIDKEGHGSVNMEEWDAICDNEWVQIWLRAQDIKAQDATSLFRMIDDGSGLLTAEKLVKGTATLKGTSSVMTILRELRETRESVHGIKSKLEAGLV